MKNNLIKRRLFAFLFSAFLLACIVLLLIGFKLSISGSIFFSIVFLAIYIFFCLFNGEMPVLSLNMLITHYMVVEAIGIPMSFLFDWNYASKRLYREVMFYGEYLSQYLYISLSAICVFLLFLILTKKNQKNNVKSANSFNHTYYYSIGLFVLCLATIYFLYGALSGRLILFSYSEYKASSDRIMNYALRGYWFSAIFICCGGTKKQIFKALPVFAVASAILLMAGNRNDIFFPLFIGLGIYVKRFQKLPKFVLVLCIVLIFLISPLISLTRNSNNISLSSVSVFSLISQSLFEFGGQLKAVSNMFLWVKTDGYAYGITYLLGIIGSIFYPFHIGIETSIQSSKYWIGNKISNIGFAMFGEVFYNFGFLGMLIVYSTLGVFLANFDTKDTKNIDKMVLHSYIYFWLLILVRNSFSFTFTYFIMFLALYFLEKICRELFGRRAYQKCLKY